MFYPPPKKKQTKLKTVAVKRTSSEVLRARALISATGFEVNRLI